MSFLEDFFIDPQLNWGFLSCLFGANGISQHRPQAGGAGRAVNAAPAFERVAALYFGDGPHQERLLCPVIVNENMVIIDGHNRQAICEEHGIPYQMAVFSFDDLLEAKQWIVGTQRERWNLEPWELEKIALRIKPEIETKAKANMSAGGGDQKSDAVKSGSAIVPNPISTVDTHKELARSVGLGERTMGKVMQNDEHAPFIVKEVLDKKELSVNQGY